MTFPRKLIHSTCDFFGKLPLGKLALQGNELSHLYPFPRIKGRWFESSRPDHLIPINQLVKFWKYYCGLLWTHCELQPAILSPVPAGSRQFRLSWLQFHYSGTCHLFFFIRLNFHNYYFTMLTLRVDQFYGVRSGKVGCHGGSWASECDSDKPPKNGFSSSLCPDCFKERYPSLPKSLYNKLYRQDWYVTSIFFRGQGYFLPS